ncbi:phospholipase A [Colwellia sp.]|uniref:phospholipase A n=1 Tax=Colwellia sp. TaxID=56799 RepID=UPI00345E045F
MGGLIFNTGDFVWGVRAWWRIPEEQKSYELDPTGDDTPNIEDYIGYGELISLWKIADGHNVDIQLRNNRRSDNKSSVMLGWSFPLTKNLRGSVQYFNGYGESLIYYNHHSERLGIGVKLTDWL